MLTARLLALVVSFSALASNSVSAQTLFAFAAPIAPEGAIIGRLRDAPLTVIDWIGPREVRVRYQDAELRLETAIDLVRAQRAGETATQIVIGTARRGRVEAGPWDVTMEAGAWAPLRGFEGDAWRIALPPNLPEDEGLVRGLRPLRGTPRSAFDHRVVSLRHFESACADQLEVRANADAGSARWRVPATAAYRITSAPPQQPRPSRGQLAPGPLSGSQLLRVEVRVQGFVVRGFIDAPPAPCEGSIGLGGMGTMCGDGVSDGLIVRVPAGTPLYATATSTEPFATLRRPVIARERGAREAGAPAPTGPQQLLFDRTAARGGDWSFVAHVRVPFETLARVTGPRGFGHCGSPPSDWR